MDNEVSGNGNQYDNGFRIYNPRLGRFLSVYPLTSSYPWYTPYQFTGNKPTRFVDLDGLEEYDIMLLDDDKYAKIKVIHTPTARYGETGQVYRFFRNGEQVGTDPNGRNYFTSTEGFTGFLNDKGIASLEKALDEMKDYPQGNSRTVSLSEPTPGEIPTPSIPSTPAPDPTPITIEGTPVVPGQTIKGVTGSQNFDLTTGQLGSDAQALVNQIVEGINCDPSITGVTVDVKGALPIGSGSSTYNTVRQAAQNAKNNIVNLLRNGGVPDNVSKSTTSNTVDNVYQHPPAASPGDANHKDDNGISFKVE